MKTASVLGLAVLVLGLALQAARAEEAAKPGRQPAAQNESLVKGTVITVGEAGRLIIQKEEGGQMTLEPRFVRVEGRMQGHPEIIKFVNTLKQGDKVEAFVRPGDGGHFMNWGIAKPDGEMVGRLPAQPGGVWPVAAAGGEGGRRPDAAPAEELRALRSEIGDLRKEVAALKELVSKLVERK